MKRTGIWLALALGLASHGVMAKTLNVVSSFSVLGDMVQQIGGEHVHVDTLVGPDGDPHTFEPSPKDSALLNNAALAQDLASQKFPAEQRYRTLATDRPDLVRRLPQREIASLLNITDSALSRIAKRVRSAAE